MNICRNCKYFKPHLEGEYGACKRRAPSPAHYSVVLAAQLLADIHYKTFDGYTSFSTDLDWESNVPNWASWPTVSEGEDCGEWEPNDSTVSAEQRLDEDMNLLNNARMETMDICATIAETWIGDHVSGPSGPSPLNAVGSAIRRAFIPKCSCGADSCAPCEHHDISCAMAIPRP